MEIKFSLAKNAISSLHISLENFKAFYYHELENSLFEEKIKISVTFLENAIELLLKTVLAAEDVTSIFIQPDNEIIQEAIEQVDEHHSLIDVLLEKKADVRTIFYHEAVEEYNKKYHQSKKVYDVLKELGDYRNNFTHFGIRIASYDEIVCVFINTFDVIYNYLYPQLCDLDEIGDNFISDDLIVETIHGYKWLFDDDFIYNNFLDFFDEILGDGNSYVLNLCRNNEKKNIQTYERFVQEAIDDKKLKFIIEKHNVQIDIETHCDNPLYYLFKKDGLESSILIRYLPYYNAGLYTNEAGHIMFVVMFGEKKIYLYKDKADYPEFCEKDMDRQWENDERKGLCERIELSKNNIIKTFERIIEREFY